MLNINPLSILWATLFDLLGRNSVLFFCIVLFIVLLIWLYKVCAQRSKEAQEKLIKDLSSKVIAYTELKYSVQLYLLHGTTDSLEKLYKKTAEVSIIISPSLLTRLNRFYQLKLEDDLATITLEIDNKISDFRRKLSIINEEDYDFDGPFGKLLYFVSLLKHVTQPLFLALLIIVTIFLILIWLYSFTTSTSDLDKLLIMIYGFALVLWILSIFASMEIIAESKINFSLLSIIRFITSIILWASPVLFIFNYGGIVFTVIQVVFLFLLPRLREKPLGR